MKCHICNQQTASFTHKKTNIIYYHCEACEYIFKSPKYYKDFEAQKERYNLHENNAEDEGYVAYFRRFLDFVLPLVGKSESALDFGCGRTSLLATLLAQEGIACDFYDPIYHPDSLQEGKRYDLIVSTEVFEHLHQPRVVFKSLVESLNKGGYLAIQTEFHANSQDLFEKWWYPQDPTHIVFFQEQTFRLLGAMYGCMLLASNGKNMVVMQKV